jgi:hypothetical protein
MKRARLFGLWMSVPSLAVLTAGLAASLGCSGGTTGAIDARREPDAGTRSAPAPIGAADSGTPFSGPTGTTGEMLCGTGGAARKKSPLTVEFLVDASASSDEAFSLSKTVLRTLGAEFAITPDPDFRVGLLVFSDTQDSTGGKGPYPSSADLAPSSVNATHLASLLGRMSGKVDGLSPVVAALNGAYAVLDKAAVGRKLVVHLSAGGLSDSPAADAASIALIKEKAKLGSELVSVAFENELFEDYLFSSAFAKAGGRSPAKCNPYSQDPADYCHVQVPKPAKANVGLAIDAIRRNIDEIRENSCSFPLQASGSLDLGMASVVFTDGAGNSTSVAASNADGYAFDSAVSPKEIVLHGRACRTFRDAPGGKIEIRVSCKR